MDKRLKRILPRVQKPARYTGGEYNQILKNKDEVDLRLAFCFPDTYEIGMSNLGLSILYHTMNSLPFVWCERVFAPWGDMYDEMKQAGIPLYALESGDPVSEFDTVAFSVGYEMAYTTVLDMLDMAGIPLRSEDRPELLPLIWAGGTAGVNAEPMAPFMDLFVIGEGEEMNNELLTLLRQAKLEGWSKHDFLRAASQIGGVYVPSLYEVSYLEDGNIASVTPKEGAPEKVTKRIISNLDAVPFPTSPIVPSTEVVHDRVSLELFRGCVRGCRFCQAGHVYRPIRAKKKETLVRQGIEALKNTGYQELTLLSLSTSDYRELPALCDGLLEYCEERSIGLSLPSLRADNFSMEIMQRLQKVRKSGLTFAVEGGSQRLRDCINKNVTEEDLLHTCAIAFAGGWNSVKLYYMLGLPTETDEDILGIAEMANQVLHCWRLNAKNKNRGVLHLLLYPEAAQPLPVGGADQHRGIHAPGEPAARSHHGKERGLQLARRPDQPHRGGALQGRPPGGGCHRAGVPAGRTAGRVDGLFLLRALDAGVFGLRHRSGLLRQPRNPDGCGASLGPHRRRCVQGPSAAGTGAGLSCRALTGLPEAVLGLRRGEASDGGKMRWIN